MHAESHRLRLLITAVLLSLLGLVLLARPAHSTWSSDPVQVHATTALCPLVSACADAHSGAIIAWQENTASGGLLMAQHVLANGDLDPAWSAPAALSSADVARTALGMVGDGQGGAYVWWMENATLFLTRVSPTGVVAAGWPARGRSLGLLYSNRVRPSVAADGSGGLYVAWLAGTPGDAFASTVRALHVGPANAAAGGWPGGGRTLATSPDFAEFANALGIDAAPDGGLWVAFATTAFDGVTLGPGEVRVARYTAAGLPAAGWDAHGVALAASHGEALINLNWKIVPGMSLVAVANDGGAGAFVSHGDVDVSGVPGYRLSRVASDGSTAPGWAAQGLDLAPWGYAPDFDAGANASLRALADGSGGVLAGVPGFGSESTAIMQFERRSGAGSWLPGGVDIDQLGLEFAPRGDGGMFVASFYPSGPTSPFSPNAYIRAVQSDPGTGFLEYHDTPVVTWYGDVALAATGDGGAIFGWSQVNGRFGVFAVRLNPAGMVTAVPPAPVKGPPSLRLRFVPGVGVRALIASVPAGREDLALYDASGRWVAGTSIEDADGGDWVFPGTERLASGLYFARAASGGVLLRARVAVVR